MLDLSGERNIPLATKDGRPVDAISKPALAALVRLRQIASEMRGAAQRHDLPVVCTAATLLKPTLARCLEQRDCPDGSAEEAAAIARETHALLQECEILLNQAMQGVTVEMKRIRQGKRTVRQAKDRTTGKCVSVRLDATR